MQWLKYTIVVYRAYLIIEEMLIPLVCLQKYQLGHKSLPGSLSYIMHHLVAAVPTPKVNKSRIYWKIVKRLILRLLMRQDLLL